jgi:hypothetical protein
MTQGAHAPDKTYGEFPADESPLNNVDADQLYVKASPFINADQGSRGPAFQLDVYPGFSDE